MESQVMNAEKSLVEDGTAGVRRTDPGWSFRSERWGRGEDHFPGSTLHYTPATLLNNPILDPDFPR
jgi:hypothetical protein